MVNLKRKRGKTTVQDTLTIFSNHDFNRRHDFSDDDFSKSLETNHWRHDFSDDDFSKSLET